MTITPRSLNRACTGIIALVFIAAAGAQISPINVKLVPQTGGGPRSPFVALSRSGTLAATSDGHSQICLWRTSDGTLIWRIELSGWLRHLEFAPDASRLLVVVETLGSLRADGSLVDKPHMQASVLNTADSLEREKIEGPSAGTNWVHFGHTGSTLIVGMGDSVPLVFEPDGSRKAKIAPYPESWDAVSLSPNDKTMAYNVNLTEVALFDRSTKQETKLPSFPESISAIQFSPDGKMLVVGDASGTITFWDARRAALLRTRQIKGGQCSKMLPFCHAIQQITFSPSGDSVITATIEGNARRWSTNAGDLLTNCDTPNWSRLSLDLSAPRISDIFFDSAGRYFFIQTIEKTLIWNTASNSRSNPFEKQLVALSGSDGHDLDRTLGDGLPSSLAVSVADKKMITDADVGEANGLFIWNDWNHAPTLDLHTRVSSLYGLLMDSNSQLLATTNFETINLWDLKKGAIVSTVRGPKVRPVAFSPAGDKLLIRSGGLKVWNLDSDLISPIPHSSGIGIFSKDGNSIYTIFRGSVENWSLDGLTRAPVANIGKIPVGASLWMAGPYLGVQETHKVLIVDKDTGAVKIYGNDESKGDNALLSIDGSYILVFPRSFRMESSVRLLNSATGAEVDHWPATLPGAETILGFTDDGHRKLAMGQVNGIVIRDLESGTEHLIQTAGANLPDIAGYLVQCSCIVSSDSEDGVRLIDVNTGTLKANLFATARPTDPSSSLDDNVPVKLMRGNRSLVVEPNGRFDTNDFDTNSLEWVISNDPLNPTPVESFLRDFYFPRLLPRIVDGSLPPPAEIVKRNRLRPSVIIESVKPLGPGTDKVQVSLAATEETMGGLRSGIYDLRLYRDGRLVHDDPERDAPPEVGDAEAILREWRTRKQLSGSTPAVIQKTYIIELPRTAAKTSTIFTAYAFNADRVKGDTVRFSLPAVPSLPQNLPRIAYVVGIGVADNKNAKLKLLYPVQDVRLLAQELVPRLEASGRFDKVQLVSLVSVQDPFDGKPTDVLPSKNNIAAVFDLLAGRNSPAVEDAPETIRRTVGRATPNDTVIVLYSGHGEKDKSDIFRMFPYDSDNSERPMSLISSFDVADWMRDVDVGEAIILLDACHSGAATGVDFRPGPMGDAGLGQLAYDKGMRILVATQPNGIEVGLGAKQDGILTDRLMNLGLRENQAGVGPKFDWYAWLRFGAKRTGQIDPQLFDFSPENAN